MTTKFECDRCGSQTEDSDNIGGVHYPHLNGNYTLADTKIKRDLCFPCVKALHEFMKSLPKNNFP